MIAVETISPYHVFCLEILFPSPLATEAQFVMSTLCFPCVLNLRQVKKKRGLG